MAQIRPDRTLGPGHDDFWRFCAAGELRIQHCPRCGHYSWPVVEACEDCGSTALDWAPMSGRGTVAAWATFERDYYRGVLPIPWNTIVVELEEGPLFLSNPSGFGWAETRIGMPVRLAFIDAEDSAGPFRLPVFEKA